MSRSQPAYPQSDQLGEFHTGKTMLDSFAEVALLGILTGNAYEIQNPHLASWAYNIAEEMMLEKSKREAK